MKSKDYLKDLNEIKHLMNKSSRFMSLSWLSGILAGIYDLTGAFFVNRIINKIKESSNELERYFIAFDSVITLLLIAFAVLFLSVLTAIYLSWRKAKTHNENLCASVSMIMFINILIQFYDVVLFIFFCVVVDFIEFLYIFFPFGIYELFEFINV